MRKEELSFLQWTQKTLILSKQSKTKIFFSVGLFDFPYQKQMEIPIIHPVENQSPDYFGPCLPWSLSQ